MGMDQNPYKKQQQISLNKKEKVKKKYYEYWTKIKL